MKRKDSARWPLLGASLLMVFLLGTCSGARSENGSAGERVAKLSAQIADLAKKTDDLTERIRKDRVAKDARLAAIENQIEEIDSKLKK